MWQTGRLRLQRSEAIVVQIGVETLLILLKRRQHCKCRDRYLPIPFSRFSRTAASSKIVACRPMANQLETVKRSTEAPYSRGGSGFANAL